MLKKFTLENYKNFKDKITIDFENIAGYQFNTDCITDGTISKMLIYGKNATGKTNLGRALIDIYTTIFDGLRYVDTGVFLNADSKDNTATFSYEFKFASDVLLYKYTKFSSQELKNEELYINGKTIFNYDFEHNNFIEINLRYIDAETANTSTYLQSADIEDGGDLQGVKLPFLRWLISNVALSNDSVLIKLVNYIRKMLMITTKNAALKYPRKMNENFYEFLEGPKRLTMLERFLNEMGIECKLKLRSLPDGQKELYFVHEKLVPFYDTASSGTLALVDLYKRLIPRIWKPSFIYLDEFDAFYHYEMAEKVINFLKRRYPKCQIIMTSHNTNLMTNQIMRPDCLFILSKARGLTSFNNATDRELREGHNLEKMYISGEFDKYE